MHYAATVLQCAHRATYHSQYVSTEQACSMALSLTTRCNMPLLGQHIHEVIFASLTAAPA